MTLANTTFVEHKTSWLDIFGQHCTESGCSPATVKAYRQDLTHFAAWFTAHNRQPFHPGLLTRALTALADAVDATRAELRRRFARKLDFGDDPAPAPQPSQTTVN